MASSWPATELGEVIEILDSKRIPLSSRERQQRQGAFPYYGAQGIIDHIDDYIFDGQFILVAEDGENLNSRKLPLALMASGKFWVNNHAHIIRAKPGVSDDLFLLHSLNCTDIKPYVTGAAQPKLSQANMRLIKIALPPLPIQRRIAGILSAYDDLIENSQRRIKILEEMARRLYREWFVHFRFPGHEGCRFVDSPLGEIPEGWEVRPFSALASYVNGYPFKPAQLGKEGKPIIKIKELKAGIVADTPRNTGENIPDKYHVSDGDVLFSWSADLDAYLWTGGEGLLNQHLFNVLPAGDISQVFCFHALKESMPRFRALSLGATMHHIKRSALDQVFTVVSPGSIRSQFQELVAPMHMQLVTLARHARNLRRTRDLLLPRLLSGQIDMEALPEAALTEP